MRSVPPLPSGLEPERGLPAPSVVRSWGISVLAVATILAMLYLGRALLVPVTLAVVLSFAIAPLVRTLGRFGLTHAASVFAAISTVGLVLAAAALVIGFEAYELVGSLPAYETTIAGKLDTVHRSVVERMRPVEGAAVRILRPVGDDHDGVIKHGLQVPVLAGGVVPVEIRNPPVTPADLVRRALASLWGPVGSAGVVAIVLVFVLLEHESLRDRFIRLAGGSDLRATTNALNDAGDRLSRYFVRQVAVNACVGLVLGLALWGIGLPHATLWAALAAVLRFVPYVGYPIATLCALTLALAVDPGWSLTLTTLAAFVAVQLCTSQIIEPRLYGHATGLSPLSVVLATLFWGWLWGPVGAIMATPLTLCLAVAGRHTRSFAAIDIILGDGPALTLPQKFYQRALSGDSDEIIRGARDFLKRKPLAVYCDTILMPALALGRIDLASGAITADQQSKLRGVVVAVIESLAGAALHNPFRLPHKTVLSDPSPGRDLRARRLQRQRERIGSRLPAEVDANAVVRCVSLEGLGDDLAAELLVRILRGLHLDARHLLSSDLRAAPVCEDAPVSTFCIVAVSAESARACAELAVAQVRAKQPNAVLVGLFLSAAGATEYDPALLQQMDRAANSFEDAVLEITELNAGFSVPPGTD